MKKFLALVMAMMMVLAMGTAFAENDYSNKLDQPASFNKDYNVLGNTNAAAPAETFDFSFTYQGYKANATDDAWVTTVTGPAIDTVSATFANAVPYNADAEDGIEVTTSVPVTLDASKFPQVGIYKYEVSEADDGVAGITYNTNKLYLIVTILNGAESTTTANVQQYVAAVHYVTENGDKTGSLTNTYNAGQLEVKKTITGNLADMTKQFVFTITLTPKTGDIFADNQNVCSASDATVVKNENGSWTYTVSIGHDETVTFSNIPAGTTYTVSEAVDGYTCTAETYSDTDKVITTNETDTAYFTNNLGTTVDTGFGLDNAPYMMIMAMVLLAGVAMMMKRRAY